MGRAVSVAENRFARPPRASAQRVDRCVIQASEGHNARYAACREQRGFHARDLNDFEVVCVATDGRRYMV